LGGAPAPAGAFTPSSRRVWKGAALRPGAVRTRRGILKCRRRAAPRAPAALRRHDDAPGARPATGGPPLARTLAGLGYAALVAYAGRCVSRTRHWTFVIVIAALSCAFFPFGTALGVFTILVLSKPEVKALFPSQATATANVATPPG
jgi:hypothetical protein